MICIISFPGGTTVLNTEKPTVIDNTLQPGKKKYFSYWKHNKFHIQISCQRQNNELQHFLTSHSLKVSEVKKHLVSQLCTVNILLLSSTCRHSGEQDFLLHQQMPNADKIKLTSPHSSLCLRVACQWHKVCLQTLGKQNQSHGGYLTIYNPSFTKLRQVKFASFLQQGAGIFTILFSSKFSQNGVTWTAAMNLKREKQVVTGSRSFLLNQYNN